MGWDRGWHNVENGVGWEDNWAWSRAPLKKCHACSADWQIKIKQTATYWWRLMLEWQVHSLWSCLYEIKRCGGAMEEAKRVSPYFSLRYLLKVCCDERSLLRVSGEWCIQMKWMIHKNDVCAPFCIVSLPILPPAYSFILSRRSPPSIPSLSASQGALPPFSFLTASPCLHTPPQSQTLFGRCLFFLLTYYTLTLIVHSSQGMSKKEWADRKI